MHSDRSPSAKHFQRCFGELVADASKNGDVIFETLSRHEWFQFILDRCARGLFLSNGNQQEQGPIEDVKQEAMLRFARWFRTRRDLGITPEREQHFEVWFFAVALAACRQALQHVLGQAVIPYSHDTRLEFDIISPLYHYLLERPDLVVQELRRVNEQLQQRVQELERERQLQQQRLQQLEVDLEKHRRSLAVSAQELFAHKKFPFTEQELQRRVKEEDGVPLENFLPLLRNMETGQ